MRTLSVVCPDYNEEEVIEQFDAVLHRSLEQIPDRYQARVLFVADRGTDNTFSNLEGIPARDSNVRVPAPRSRFGHQMALVARIDHSDADAVVTLDSDLQHSPELIPTTVDAFEEGHDIVYGIRQESGDSRVFAPWASRLFYKVLDKLSQIPVPESAAESRLISRRVAEVLRHQIRKRNQFLRGLFSCVGFTRTGIPFKLQPRAGGRKRYSLGRLARFAVEGITSISKPPLQAAIFAGFGFALLGLVLAFITLIRYFHYSQLPSSWTTIVMLMAVFTGMQLIFLRIVGEYLGGDLRRGQASAALHRGRKINFEAN